MLDVAISSMNSILLVLLSCKKLGPRPCIASRNFWYQNDVVWHALVSSNVSFWKSMPRGMIDNQFTNIILFYNKVYPPNLCY